MEKKLYPMKFVVTPGLRTWGGDYFIKELGKKYYNLDDAGNEVVLDSTSPVGESWELADMGFEDSVVSNGWLMGNALSDVMETYLERVVGENVYNYFGRQFPVLVKLLDVKGRTPLMVCPDDEIAAERYDSLGKSTLWYVLEAGTESKIYAGFNRDVTAAEFYERCLSGSVEDVLNVIQPKKGDVLHIAPGTVYAAEGGLVIAEIQESSDLSFCLYNWGAETDSQADCQIQLEEAIDVINYSVFDQSLYQGACGCHGHSHHDCCHEHEHEDEVTKILLESPQFNVTKVKLADPLHIYTEKFESFIIYVCIEGAASIQIPSPSDDGPSLSDARLPYHV